MLGCYWRRGLAGAAMSGYWCCNCEAVRELDVHGKCSCCDSEAVCLTEPGRIVYDGRLVERLVRAVETVEGK